MACKKELRLKASAVFNSLRNFNLASEKRLLKGAFNLAREKRLLKGASYLASEKRLLKGSFHLASEKSLLKGAFNRASEKRLLNDACRIEVKKSVTPGEGGTLIFSSNIG